MSCDRYAVTAHVTRSLKHTKASVNVLGGRFLDTSGCSCTCSLFVVHLRMLIPNWVLSVSFSVLFILLRLSVNVHFICEGQIAQPLLQLIEMPVKGMCIPFFS